MQHLPYDAKKDLLDGAHVCRHSEGAAAVSGDQFREQTYPKQGKQAGGMTGISTNPEQVAILDKQDRQRIVDELRKYSHPLTDHFASLYNIVNGKVAYTNDVNVHDAIKIGQEMQQKFIASLPDGIHISIKQKVKTM